MSKSVPQVFYAECDRCGEIHDAGATDLGNGCYCPKCLATIAQDNATPRTLAAALDERTNEVARLARRG